jgi:hypothetical protein
MRMRIGHLFVLLAAGMTLAGGMKVLAGKPSGDVPVTTNISDFNAAGAPYSVFSDGGGAYQNGVSGVQSILEANGYNQITWGDWLLNLFSSTSRTVAVTFSTANAVQPGDPGYTAPANPPYWGTKWWGMHMENKCSLDFHDMHSMKVGDKFNCDFLFRFPIPGSSDYYRLDMVPDAPSIDPAPESQQAQVQCNSTSNSDGACNDWFIDPAPVINPDGSTSPGQARARLTLVNSKGKTAYTDEGDFYLTFHMHVTRP